MFTVIDSLLVSSTIFCAKSYLHIEAIFALQARFHQSQLSDFDPVATECHSVPSNFLSEPKQLFLHQCRPASQRTHKTVVKIRNVVTEYDMIQIAFCHPNVKYRWPFQVVLVFPYGREYDIIKLMRKVKKQEFVSKTTSKQPWKLCAEFSREKLAEEVWRFLNWKRVPSNLVYSPSETGLPQTMLCESKTVEDLKCLGGCAFTRRSTKWFEKQKTISVRGK